MRAEAELLLWVCGCVRVRHKRAGAGDRPAGALKGWNGAVACPAGARPNDCLLYYEIVFSNRSFFFLWEHFFADLLEGAVGIVEADAVGDAVEEVGVAHGAIFFVFVALDDAGDDFGGADAHDGGAGGHVFFFDEAALVCVFEGFYDGILSFLYGVFFYFFIDEDIAELGAIGVGSDDDFLECEGVFVHEYFEDDGVILKIEGDLDDGFFVA